MSLPQDPSLFMSAQQLETFLKQQIPITQSFGIKVTRVEEAIVEIHAPLAANRNHLGTAFGGSLSAVLILTGYAWLYHILAKRGHSCHVIIKNCQTSYLKPVTGDLRALCEAPPVTDYEHFAAVFAKKGRAKITLESRIVLPNGATACSAVAEFVAVKS